ncbi:hypothetical protein L9F63_025988, partial [Diploptera punctata]
HIGSDLGIKRTDRRTNVILTSAAYLSSCSLPVLFKGTYTCQPRKNRNPGSKNRRGLWKCNQFFASP